MPRKNPEELRETRKVTLYAAWDLLAEYYKPYALVPALNPVIVEQAIDDYILSRNALTARLNISGRINRPKIAGLMASAILKTKPVGMCDRDHSPAEPTAYRSTQGNELLAFWHGLCICAEGISQEEIDHLLQNPKFTTWMEDLIALFHYRPDSPECFAMIFETLTMAFFPNNLSVKGA